MQLTITQIRQSIARHKPKTLTADRGHAAVSLILAEETTGPEILFIRRAPHDLDPWSGDIGFPGGRLQGHSESARQAAERETFEELNLELPESSCIGRLDDLYGATLPILVSCFVYLLEQKPELTPNHEIASTFWFPVAELLEESRHHMATLNYRGQTIIHPAVDILGRDRTVLWGITYRLIRQFFGTLGHEFGSAKIQIDAHL